MIAFLQYICENKASYPINKQKTPAGIEYRIKSICLRKETYAKYPSEKKANGAAIFMRTNPPIKYKK